MQHDLPLPIWNVSTDNSSFRAPGGKTWLTESRFRQKVDLVIRATRKHATNLARFATIYKLVMLALKHYGPTPGKEGMFYPARAVAAPQQ